MSNKLEMTKLYGECEETFHQYALAVGYAQKGVQKVPDLNPKRDVFVGTLLRDDSLSKACGDDPKIYYYNVLRYCLTAGIEYGAQWQLKPDGFEEEGYDNILYRNNVGRSSDDITKDIAASPAAWKEFLIGLHRVWLAEMKDYLEQKDPTEPIVQSCFAVFQLGVSIALDKFDEPPEKKDDAPEAGETKDEEK